VNEKINKFKLHGAKLHFIYNVLQNIFLLVWGIRWDKYCVLFYWADHSKCKGKAITFQVWTGPDDSRKLRLPDFMTIVI
jgi:hypothetical protein